jgi:hypothetical protein
MVHVPPSGRMAFLAERQALGVQPFDTVQPALRPALGRHQRHPCRFCSSQRNA